MSNNLEVIYKKLADQNQKEKYKIIQNDLAKLLFQDKFPMSDGRSTDRIEKLFLGENVGGDSDGPDNVDGGFEGLFVMAGNTNEKTLLSLGGPKIKRSAQESLKIIHKMLLTKSYKYKDLVEEEFRTFETK